MQPKNFYYVWHKGSKGYFAWVYNRVNGQDRLYTETALYGTYEEIVAAASKLVKELNEVKQ